MIRLSVDLRHVDDYYLNAHYHFGIEGSNSTQVMIQANNAQEVLFVETFGAQWQIDHKQTSPAWAENRNISLNSENWLPMRQGSRNKTYYIDFQAAVTFSVDPSYRAFKIRLVQQLADETEFFAASPHLVYRISQQNILQEIWILITS